jgi:cytochrome P450
VGLGLITSDGEYGLRQRRLAQPAFHRKRLATLASTMSTAAEETAGRWQSLARGDEPVDIAREMMHLTLRIVGQALFSTDTSADAGKVSRAVDVAIEYVNFRLNHPYAFSERVPTPRNLRFLRSRRTLDKVVNTLIEERRRSGTDTGDLLSMLLLARDEATGKGMSDRQLRDEVMTILLAGHETTAVALSWTWYLLSQHPQIEGNLHDELDGVLGGRTPTIEDVPNLPYTRMIVDEALRLYPPAWGVARQTRDTDEIRGYTIDRGTPIAMLTWVTHRHPEFWDAPEVFEPERFTPARSAGRPHFAYLPFGGGPRQCIGNNFALMETQIILATLAQQYAPRLAQGHRVEPQPLLTLRPRYGMRMHLHPRKG